MTAGRRDLNVCLFFFTEALHQADLPNAVTAASMCGGHRGHWDTAPAPAQPECWDREWHHWALHTAWTCPLLLPPHCEPPASPVSNAEHFALCVVRALQSLWLPLHLSGSNKLMSNYFHSIIVHKGFTNLLLVRYISLSTSWSWAHTPGKKNPPKGITHLAQTHN